jgi:uroporphyrin-III C-methyltransferase / precorrin-2 dehydrogenase / sirohydrochlorin ferrochelatase
MRFLPIFLDLQRGVVLLVGSGDPARAKLRLLTAAGAQVRWYATDGDYDLGGIAAENAARIEPAAGDPLTMELGNVIAIVCAGAGELAPAIAARARAAGLPVNVMDDLEHSSFIFPAIVDRGDLVVAVGTGGASPVVARRVRERIEALLPERIGELATFVGRWRKTIHKLIPDFSQRRRFWERVVDGPIGALVLAGRSDEAEAALRDIPEPCEFAGALPSGETEGSVTLVGAGPGDADLLTVKALRTLQDADVVFHDELVTPEILDRARRDAARIPVGRRVGQPGIGQETINRLLIEAAKAGQRVVRLKGGDPFVFGRGGEEVEALRAAGVAYSVIPGITASLGAAAQFEVPLTFRGEALRVTFLTAHNAQDAQSVDWSTLADTKTTVVIYMGLMAAAAVQAGLLAAGRSPQTPLGVFARVTRGDASSAIGTLDELTDLVERVGAPPAILIVGDVVGHAAPARRQQLTQLASYFQVAAE